MTTETHSSQSETRSDACLNCERPFEPTRDWSRFCSDSCRAEHWRRAKESPPSVAAELAGEMEQQCSVQNHNRPVLTRLIQRSTKIGRILSVLATGAKLNRFEAEPLGDHCLHSTVATIQQRYGIGVSRRDEVVCGYGGHQTRCCRYWLEPEQQEKAARLLGLVACRSQS